jgi:microcystin-dependent protein
MADPFFGEIRIFGCSYPPYGWAICNGSQMSIQQYQALYAVIGNTYGGDQKTYFILPNLVGHAVAGAPTPTTLGASTNSGASAITLTNANLPAHNHIANAPSPATVASLVTAPTANSLLVGCASTTPPAHTAARAFAVTGTVPSAVMDSSMVGPTGGAPVMAHENHQPYLVMNFCIALTGEWPYMN